MIQLLAAILPTLLGRVENDDPGMDAKPTRYSATMQGAHAMAVGVIIALMPDMDEGMVQEGIAGLIAFIGLLRNAYGRWKADQR